MRTLTKSTFEALIAQADIQPRLKRELRFEQSTGSMPESWEPFELVAVTDRAGAKGVLLLQPSDELFIVQFELASLAASSTTGRAQSIVCDFCYTWQRGSNAGSVSLINRKTKRSVRFLCCGDLDCSRNVRTLTEAARLSRTQLRESLDTDGRVNRLKQKLSEKIHDLSLEAAA